MFDLLARILNVTFRGAGTSAFGFIVEQDGFNGWEDGGTSRSSQVSIPLAHGDYDLPQYLDSRIIAFSGVCKAPTPQALADYGQRFRGLLAWGQTSERLIVTHQGVTSWAAVKLAPSTTPKFVSDGGQADDGSWFARFNIQFKAADPRRYVRPEREFLLPTATPVRVYHRGNFHASARIVVSGSGSNDYTINGPAGTGLQYRVTRDLDGTHPHTIDFRSGHLLIGGTRVVGGIARADTWPIAPYGTTEFTFDANGNAATANLFVPDTSI